MVAVCGVEAATVKPSTCSSRYRSAQSKSALTAEDTKEASTNEPLARKLAR